MFIMTQDSTLVNLDQITSIRIEYTDEGMCRLEAWDTHSCESFTLARGSCGTLETYLLQIAEQVGTIYTGATPIATAIRRHKENTQ